MCGLRAGPSIASTSSLPVAAATVVATMLELIAIAFAEETIAAQAAQELERTVDDLAIDPDAIGVVICERDGSCQLLTKRRPGTTEAWCTFWGRLLETLMEDSLRSRIDPRFVADVRARLTPGSSILFVAGTARQGRHAIDALSHYGGRSQTCPLAAGWRSAQIDDAAKPLD